MTEAAFVALIGFMTALATGFFKLIAENVKEQRRNTRALEALVTETRKGNKEAKERNGHLGEQSERITELVVAHSKEAQGLVDVAAAKVTETMAGALKSLRTQSVDTLNAKQVNVEQEMVETEIVKDKK